MQIRSIDAEIEELNTKIKNANNEIDTLTEQKYELQAEYRKLEAEVGPKIHCRIYIRQCR